MGIDQGFTSVGEFIAALFLSAVELSFTETLNLNPKPQTLNALNRSLHL